MPLTNPSLVLNAGWTLTKPHTGFLNSQYGPDSAGFSLAGVATGFNQLLARIDTIAASGTVTIDVSAYTDLCDNAVTLSKALYLLLIPTGTTGGVLKLEPGASNGLVWFFSGTTPAISIPVNGVFLFSMAPAVAAGQVIDGSHKTLLLTNTGSVSMSVKTILLGGT